VGGAFLLVACPGSLRHGLSFVFGGVFLLEISIPGLAFFRQELRKGAGDANKEGVLDGSSKGICCQQM